MKQKTKIKKLDSEDPDNSEDNDGVEKGPDIIDNEKGKEIIEDNGDQENSKYVIKFI